MTTTLVTGGAGFIGSHIAVELIKLGHKTIILGDLSGGRKKIYQKKQSLLKGQL